MTGLPPSSSTHRATFSPSKHTTATILLLRLSDAHACVGTHVVTVRWWERCTPSFQWPTFQGPTSNACYTCKKALSTPPPAEGRHQMQGVRANLPDGAAPSMPLPTTGETGTSISAHMAASTRTAPLCEAARGDGGLPAASLPTSTCRQAILLPLPQNGGMAKCLIGEHGEAGGARVEVFTCTLCLFRISSEDQPPEPSCFECVRKMIFGRAFKGEMLFAFPAVSLGKFHYQPPPVLWQLQSVIDMRCEGQTGKTPGQSDVRFNEHGAY